MTYTAVFFDLFDTLVRFERDRLPEVTIKGKTVRSTAGKLHAVLRRHLPDVTLEACYEALLSSWKEAERLRAIDHREVSAREVMRAHLDRIAAVNPQINAIVAKLDDERCLGLADEADARLARGEDVGHGRIEALDEVGRVTARRLDRSLRLGDMGSEQILAGTLNGERFEVDAGANRTRRPAN